MSKYNEKNIKKNCTFNIKPVTSRIINPLSNPYDTLDKINKNIK
jgi:hypothetical protein